MRSGIRSSDQPYQAPAHRSSYKGEEPLQATLRWDTACPLRLPVMLRAATSDAFQTGVAASWDCEKAESMSGSAARTPTMALVTLLARLQLTRGVLGLISMAPEYISAISWPCKHAKDELEILAWVGMWDPSACAQCFWHETRLV